MEERLEAQIRKLQDFYWSPADPEGKGFVALADLHRKHGDLIEARRILRDGLDRHPDIASGQVVLGWIFRDQGKTGEAEVAFRSALALDPHNVYSLRGLCDILEEEGGGEEALGLLRRLMDLDPLDDRLPVRFQALEATLNQPRAAAELEAIAEPLPDPAPSLWESDGATGVELDWGAASIQEDESGYEGGPEPLLEATPPEFETEPELAALDAELEPEPEATALEAEPEPEAVTPEAEPEPDFVSFEAVAEPEMEAPEEAVEVEVEAEAWAEVEAEPLLEAAPLEFETEPESAAIDAETEPEPEQAALDAELEPEPELAVLDVEPELEAAALEAEPEPEAVTPEAEPEPDFVSFEAVAEPEMEAPEEAVEVEVEAEAWAEVEAEPLLEASPLEFETEPESAAIDAEPEPEPEAEPEPELEAAALEAEPEPEFPPEAEVEEEDWEEPVAPEGDVAAEALSETLPDSLTTRTMGEILLRQGLLGQAKGVFQKLLDKDPGNDQIRSLLAQVNARLQGEATEAPAPKAPERVASIRDLAPEPVPVQELAPEDSEPVLAQELQPEDSEPAPEAPEFDRDLNADLPTETFIPEVMLPVEVMEPALVGAAVGSEAGRVVSIGDLAPDLIIPIGDLAPDVILPIEALAPDPPPEDPEDPTVDAFEAWLNNLQ